MGNPKRGYLFKHDRQEMIDQDHPIRVLIQEGETWHGAYAETYDEGLSYLTREEVSPHWVYYYQPKGKQ